MELSIVDFMRLLRRSWLWVASAVVVGVAAAAGVTALIQPTYTANTQLFVSIQGSGSVAELNQGGLFTQERVQTYVETVTTPAVLKPVVDDLDLDETPESLSQRVSAEAGANTVLMTISVKDESAERSAQIANAVGKSLTKTVADLEKPEAGKSSPVQISTVMPATAPPSPSSPSIVVNLGIGLLLGLAFGVSFAILRQVLDTRIRGEDGLRKITDAPVLGKIAHDDSAEKKPLITQSDQQSPRVESFKQLRTNLQFSGVGNSSPSILFTSSLAEEGKTTTSVNTAISLSESGQRVLLIDGDLRRPRVAKYLGLEGSVGLTTYLVGQAGLNDVLQPWGENELYILASGRVPPNPSELLGSNEMRALIADASAEFDVVIIDGPPLLPVADSAVISQLVGGVVLVVGAHKAKLPEVDKALDSLKLVGAKIMGVVMNRLPIKGADAYQYTYYRTDEPTSYRTEEPTNQRAQSSNDWAKQHSPILEETEHDAGESQTVGDEPVQNDGLTNGQGEAAPGRHAIYSGESSPSPQKRVRHVNPGFDLAGEGWGDADVVNSSSRPILRSPETGGFDDVVFHETRDRSGLPDQNRNAARHARR